MSPFAPNPDRDRVLDATDLVGLIGEHIALRPKGREHVGLCPFHDDRTPSFQVVSHKGTPFYKCFACGASGNAFDFLINYHKMSFIEALKHLAARAGIELTNTFERRQEPAPGEVTKESLYRANQLALKLYRRLLNDPGEGAVAREAVAKRRIAPAMVEAFQIGYAPDRRDAIETAIARSSAMTKETGREGPPPMEAFVQAGVVRDGQYGRSDLLRHRIVFPICDDLGRPIAFGGRKIREEDEPKYLNSPESPLFHKGRSLYGIHLAKQHIIKSDVAIVTEGYTDVIACHEAGIQNVVATLGTALTREHARVLQRLCSTVVLLFDGDAAGMRAADRGVEVFFAERIDVKVCTLPDDLDPDELLREPGGVEIFRRALDGSVDALTYFVRRFRAEYAAKTGVSGKQKSLEALLAKLVELGFGGLSGLRRRMILGSLATVTGLTEAALEAAMPVARDRPRGLSADGSSRTSLVEGALDEDLVRTDGLEADDDDVLPTRARREAEKFLLALLLANPSAARLSVPLLSQDELAGFSPAEPDGVGHGFESACLPLAEACPPEAFRDPDHRSIYRTWHDIVEAGQLPTFSLVLGELADSRQKGLASDLWMLGESLRERDEQSTLDRIRDAFLSFERVGSRERNQRRSISMDPSETARDDAADVASPPASDAAARAAPDGEAEDPRGRLDSVRAAQDRLQQLRARGPDVTRIPKRLRT